MQMMTLSRFALTIVASSACGTVLAQTMAPALLAGSGYAAPTAVQAAPGQILTISLYGISARTLEPFHVYDSSGKYTMLNSGISVLLFQSAEPKQVPVAVYAVQQTKCTEADLGCVPVTVLTIRLPFELQIPIVPGNVCLRGTACGNGGSALLRVFDQTTSVGDLALMPVRDNIHLLNSCDQTLMPVSALSGVALTNCIALVQHTNGQLVTKEKPASIGEVLIAWAYGLGTTSPLPPNNPMVISVGPPITILEGQLMLTTQTFDVGFTLQPNVALSRPADSLAITHPVFAGFRDAVGLYQVNIAMPAVLPKGPFIPCDGNQILSNFTITLAGLDSADGAAICVTQ
jgi:hypothetical protein